MTDDLVTKWQSRLSNFYDLDFVAWADLQAGLLRRRAAGEAVDEARIDWAHIAEELEGVANRDRREVRSRLKVLCCHLLKWVHQPEQRSASWRGTIDEQRDQLSDLFADSHTLEEFANQQLQTAYFRGQRQAEIETGIKNLPIECPWTLHQVIGFGPDRPDRD